MWAMALLAMDVRGETGHSGWETTTVHYLECDHKALWESREGCFGFSDYEGGR